MDDDPELIELFSFNLQAAGYAIGRAANGAEGLKKAKANPPDLILLDLMMPEIAGCADLIFATTLNASDTSCP